MKRVIALIVIICIIAGCLSGCGRIKALKTINVDNRVNIPYRDINADEFVRQAEGVSTEMACASYWQKEEYYNVIMTTEEIKDFNSENRELLWTNAGGSMALTDFEEKTDGDIVKELLEQLKITDDDRTLFVNGQQVGNQYFDDIDSNINADSVGSTVNVKYGFAVKRATLRRLPTNDYSNNEADDLYYDGFIMSDFMPFTPLVVLHESLDRQWYFVAMYGYCGWIEKTNTAICPDKSDWLQRQNPSDYLIVTGKEIRLPDDPYSPSLSLQLVPMGSKLPLIKASDAPESINQRYTYGSYIVKLPVRLSDGSISDEYSLIPSSDDVSVGYLPYTGNRIIEQAFKLQGDTYGWAGSFYSNDCSGIIREILLCFGIEMPRTAGLQISVKGLECISVEGTTDASKLTWLNQINPGSLLYFNGHIMIYLGMDKNEPYVMSSVGSISTISATEGTVMHVNSVFVCSLLRTTRKTGVTWLSSLEKILIF